MMSIDRNGHKGQALIYCRVSTRRQEEEGTSLDSQEKACVAHARQHGFEAAAVVHEVFSGAELWDRKLLVQARADIRAGRYQALVVYDMDRLARDPIHQAIVIEECWRHGASVLCVIEPLDDSDTGRLIQYIKGFAAKMEREKIKERNMRGKHAKMEAGNAQTWGFAPYGYRIEKDALVTIDGQELRRDRRVVHEEEAAIVRCIYRWIGEDGLSLGRVARRLNAQGTPSPGVGKFPRRGKDWAPRWNISQLSRLLHRPDYKGVAFALTTKAGAKGRRIPRDREKWVTLPAELCPALVTPELWEKAVQAATQRRTKEPDNVPDGERERLAVIRSLGYAGTRNEARQYLLRGRIFCSVCGRPMRSTPDHGRFIYRCSSRETPGEKCGGTPVPANDVLRKGVQPRNEHGRIIKADPETRKRLPSIPGVETWVWEQVIQVLEDPSLIRREIERQRQAEPTDGPAPGLESDLAAARTMLAKIDSQQKRLIRRYSEATDDSFPWELVQQEISRLGQQKEATAKTVREVEERVRRQRSSAAQLETLTQYCELVRGRLKDFDFENKRLALDALGVTVRGSGRQWELRFSIGADGSGHMQSVPTF